MSGLRWTPQERAHIRELALRSLGPLVWGESVVSLLDLLEAAEARAAEADRLRAQLAAVEAIHRPTGDDLICGTCMDSRGANQTWPCDTAEAMSGVA